MLFFFRAVARALGTAGPFRKKKPRGSGWAWPLHGSAPAAGAEAKLVMPSCSWACHPSPLDPAAPLCCSYLHHHHLSLPHLLSKHVALLKRAFGGVAYSRFPQLGTKRCRILTFLADPISIFTSPSHRTSTHTVFSIDASSIWGHSECRTCLHLTLENSLVPTPSSSSADVWRR